VKRAQKLESASTLDSGQLSSELVGLERRRAWVELLLRSSSQSLPAGPVVEVGCGRGWNLRFLESIFPDQPLVALDLTETLVWTAVRKADASGTVGTGAALPFRTASVSAVVLSTVLSSILDAELRRAVMHEVGRVLKPEGLLLFSDLRLPNPWNKSVRKVSRREWRDGLRWASSLRVVAAVPIPQVVRVRYQLPLAGAAVASLFARVGCHWCGLARQPSVGPRHVPGELSCTS
jgi:ubiquinone/menaquinone biosynthesis C-methylase UbiE